MRKLFPTFKPGERKTNRAALWASLADAAQLGDGLRVGPGLSVVRNKFGIHVGLTARQRAFALAVADTVTVLITVKPADADTRLKVRAVKYTAEDAAQTDGETDPYAFDGDAFDALPYFGFFARDYAGLEHAAMEGETAPGAPDLQDNYLECKQQGDVWVVERPPVQASSGVVGIAKVVEVVGGTAVTIQPLKTTFSAGQYIFASDGPVVPAVVFPGLSANDFSRLLNFHCLTLFQGGTWIVMQTLKWQLVAPSDAVRVTC